MRVYEEIKSLESRLRGSCIDKVGNTVPKAFSDEHLQSLGINREEEEKAEKEAEDEEILPRGTFLPYLPPPKAINAVKVKVVLAKCYQRPHF